MTGAGGGSSVCTSCPAGTYNSEAGAGGVCTACSGSHSTSLLQTTSQADCECEVGFSGDAAHSEEYRMCATGSLKLLKGPGARFECTTTRFSMCLCNAMSRAHAGTLVAPSSESQLLQLLQATVPQEGTQQFFSVCAEAPGASSTKQHYSGMDCNCFGWAEDGFDAARSDWNSLSVLQVFNTDSPWRDIPCHHRRADDGSEWQHPVDNSTCRGVSDQLLSNHMLCDWEYAGYCCECHGLDSQFHSNPASPWFDKLHSNASASVPPQEVVQDASALDNSAAVLRISRLGDPHDVAWVPPQRRHSAGSDRRPVYNGFCESGSGLFHDLGIRPVVGAVLAYKCWVVESEPHEQIRIYADQLWLAVATIQFQFVTGLVGRKDGVGVQLRHVA